MTVTPAPAHRREPPPDNAPHILLVDDDSRIRALTSRYLGGRVIVYRQRKTPLTHVKSSRASLSISSCST